MKLRITLKSDNVEGMIGMIEELILDMKNKNIESNCIQKNDNSEIDHTFLLCNEDVFHDCIRCEVPTNKQFQEFLVNNNVRQIVCTKCGEPFNSYSKEESGLNSVCNSCLLYLFN